MRRRPPVVALDPPEKCCKTIGTIFSNPLNVVFTLIVSMCVNAVELSVFTLSIPNTTPVETFLPSVMAHKHGLEIVALTVLPVLVFSIRIGSDGLMRLGTVFELA
jgi:hypothetical protein